MLQGIVFFKARQSEIEKSLLTVQSSIDFWENELDKILFRVEELENKPWYPEKDEESEALVKKCHVWLKRGELERNNLTKLEKEMDDFESKITEYLRSELEKRSKKTKKPLRIEVNVKF